jgi:topoisomerase-4 subunit A
MDDIKQFYKENFLHYASYVILDRAIPNLVDGLKPVQRRILWTLFQMDDGKLHKVANVAGQTMALHPHGDAPIIDALVNLASKGFLLDTQGNFGNPLTGDPPAAARYIETRLNGLAKETLFNPELTPFVPSYDGRAQEPVVLPAKIPLLLMQGAEGIAVGMSTKILPHNFVELLEGEIAILEERPFCILPDFPSGGIMDCTEYDQGRGKVKLRAKVKIVDDKTLVIKEICYGTTTESVIRSIDEAAKKGKIKIDSINDYTADKIEIEIKLPRGTYADKTLDLLYAFTECEVTLYPQLLVVKDRLPCEGNIHEILAFHTELLQGYLKAELEFEKSRLLEKIFEKTLEQIFIENRLYKKIEDVATYEKIHEVLANSLNPFHQRLARIPTHEDRERLLAIPIRRISLFDQTKNQDEIAVLEQKLEEVEKNLKAIKRFTIKYIQGLLKKYGSLFPRRTQIKAIEEVDKRAISERSVKVGYDPETGFVGTKVTAGQIFECSNLDKLLLLYSDGTYRVISIPEKQYVHTKAARIIWIGKADKKTVISILYTDKNAYPYVKRFIVKQFILDKEYSFLQEEYKLEYLSHSDKNLLELHFKPKGKQTRSMLEFPLEQVAIKGVSARGVRIANKELKKVKLVQTG